MKKILIVILSVFIHFISLGQQLINGDFEKWTYINTFANGDSAFKPSNWTLYNLSAGEPNYFGDRGSHSKNGDQYSIYIQSLGGNISGKGYTSFLTYGNTVGERTEIKPWKWGVPYTSRPEKVVGEYKFYEHYRKDDEGYAYILLKKYNQESKKSDTIGFGTYTFPISSVMWDSGDYTPFAMAIKYIDEITKPDTMTLVFVNTKYQEFGIVLNLRDGGVFFIDNISLVESPTSVSDAEGAKNIFTLHPNPTTENLGINTSLNIVKLAVYQSNGTKVLESPATESLDVSILPEGLYLLEAYDIEGRRVVKKFEKH